MNKYWFVDEDFNILEGEAAKKELEKTTDAKFLTKDNGIVQVSRERWNIAQQFERIGWMQKWVGSRDDRNLKHMAGFDYYACIKGLSFKHAIELGCGPFTNLRLIGRFCKVETCSLLDPLIESYLKHPNRSYNARWLNYGFVDEPQTGDPNQFFKKVTRRLKRYVAPILQKKIPISSLFSTPIEEMPTDGKYDLIIIINVIEHCYDINLVFDNIMKIALPNAILVFQDKYYDHQQVEQMVQGHYYEAGHPLMVDRKVLDKFLGNFKPLFRNVVREEITHIPGFTGYDSLFFVGQL